MKTVVNDHGPFFEVYLEAETLKEAAALTHLSMNSTKQLKAVDTWVGLEGSFKCSVIIGRKNRGKNSIPSNP